MMRAGFNRLRGTNGSTVALLPLTPEYDPDRHSVYFHALEDALHPSNRSILNVALTGSYGVGKSSILSHVRHSYKHRAIAISLSTLGFSNQPVGQSEADDPTWKTNRIQKEIVKQLLYSEDPVKMPGSRYRRMTRLRIWREAYLAGVMAVPLTLISYLAGWTQSLSLLIVLPEDTALLIHAAVFLGAAALVLGLRGLFHNKIQIDQITAGSTTISLSKAASSYFDEYLDEIVYFFEMTKRDIVIFEDIDRFDEPHIFETLRSLNEILNGAKQLKRKRIRFIYAIKDSIFDELGARAAREELDTAAPQQAPPGLDSVEAELARANRTKFFDLVIPVVPFVTHRSARDMVVQTMKGIQHQVSIELISLVARYAADMRLIKNLRNEFVVFKQVVIDAGGLDLKQDNLFAMMLYKSTHLSDFELIKLGKSDLDTVYRYARELVTDSVHNLNDQIRGARMARTNAKISNLHSEELGMALSDHVKLLVFDNHGISVESYALNREPITADSILTPEFWQELASSRGVLTVTYKSPQYSSARAIDIDRAAIEEALGEPIRNQEWVEMEQTRLDLVIAQLTEKRDFVERATMSDLMLRDDITLGREGGELTFSQVVQDNLQSELAVQLVLGGYIDKNFTLYTSTFPGNWASSNATNFILKNIEPRIPDIFYILTDDEVKALLLESGDGFLAERSARNICILDYLLASAPEKADILVRQITAYGEEERNFFLTYLEKGRLVEKLIFHLTQVWSDIFTALIEDASDDAGRQRHLFDCALKSLSEFVSYSVDESFSRYVVANYADLSTFVNDDLPPDSVLLIFELLQDAGAKFPCLAPLSPTFKAMAVSNQCYVMSRSNLYEVLGSETHSLSLDAIRSSSGDTYSYVVREVPRYLGLLHDDEHTIRDSRCFIATIVDVISVHEAETLHIVQRAAESCRVQLLQDVPSLLWTVLAEDYRFPTTFDNVLAYVEAFGIDGSLGRTLMRAESILDGSEGVNREDQEIDKRRVAIALLSAKSEIPSALLRARLVESLSLTEWIEVTDIPSESGELIGYLVAKKIISDDAESFTAIPSGDIEGFVFAITKSAKFVDFMTPSLFLPSALVPVIESTRVSDLIKSTILDRFDEFTAGASRGVLATLADYAIKRGQKLGFNEVARLAATGVVPALVLPLLRPHILSLSMDELGPVLNSLGGPYKDLTEPNGKRPRIPNTPANRELADHLCTLGVARRSEPNSTELQVNMRRK